MRLTCSLHINHWPSFLGLVPEPLSSGAWIVSPPHCSCSCPCPCPCPLPLCWPLWPWGNLWVWNLCWLTPSLRLPGWGFCLHGGCRCSLWRWDGCEGQADVPHAELATLQATKTGRPLRAAGRPAPPTHKEGVLHIHIHQLLMEGHR